MLYFDGRYRGNHGIARYSNEFRAQTALDFVDLPVSGSPSSMTDVVRLGRLRVSRADLIFSPGFGAGIARARQLVTLHDLIHFSDVTPNAGLKRAYYNQVIRPAIRKCGNVMTGSITSRDLLAEWLDDPAITIRITGYGVNEAFRPGDRTGVSARDFIYVGAVRPHKNVGRILTALAARPDYRLTVVTGDDDELHRQATDFGVVNQVTIKSGLSDEELASLYRRSTALVFASTVEGFGLPVLEALSSGCPVLHLDTCASVAEIARDFGAGATGLPDNTDDWVSAMDQISSTPPVVPPTPPKYRWATTVATMDAHIRDVAAQH